MFGYQQDALVGVASSVLQDALDLHQHLVGGTPTATTGLLLHSHGQDTFQRQCITTFEALVGRHHTPVFVTLCEELQSIQRRISDRLSSLTMSGDEEDTSTSCTQEENTTTTTDTTPNNSMTTTTSSTTTILLHLQHIIGGLLDQLDVHRQAPKAVTAVGDYLTIAVMATSDRSVFFTSGGLGRYLHTPSRRGWTPRFL